MQEQFNQENAAGIAFPFAGKEFHIIFANLTRKDYGQYRMEKAYLVIPDCTQMQRLDITNGKVVLKCEVLSRLPERGNSIMIELM